MTNPLGTALTLLSSLALGCAGAAGIDPTPSTSPLATPVHSADDAERARVPAAVCHVYVGAESADLIHRIRFGPGGAAVDETTVVGRLPVETEGSHGLNRSPDGDFVYLTTGHGVPDGKRWKFDASPESSR